MKNLMRVIEKTWSGDVTYQEAIDGFSRKQLNMMEQTLKSYPGIYQDACAIPFLDEILAGHYGDFIPPLESDLGSGMLLLQVMVNNLDGE